MRGTALDAYAWSAGKADVEKLLWPIRLWGTEEGWQTTKAMSEADQRREQHAIPQSVRALHKYGSSEEHCHPRRVDVWHRRSGALLLAVRAAR